MRVDPDDDSIRRYVVHHYRYDPERHERRHVVVAAFDNEKEYKLCIDETAAALRRRKSSGDVSDAREHVSGTVYEAGDRQRQANARLVQRAIEHGASTDALAELDLPPSFGLLRLQSEADRARFPAGARVLQRLAHVVGQLVSGTTRLGARIRRRGRESNG